MNPVPVPGVEPRRSRRLKVPSSVQLILELPATSMDAALREGVAPLTRALLADPRLRAFYYQRHVKPDWNLRISFLARDAGLRDAVEERAPRFLEHLERNGVLSSWRWAEPDRAAQDLAGPDAALDVERLFHHDSVASLDLLACEDAAEEGTSRSRREFSLVMTERVLGLLEFDLDERLAFYRLGHRRPFEQGTWSEDDRPALENRYRSLRDSLGTLLGHALAPELVWGGRRPAEIARCCLEASRPHLEALRRADAREDLPAGIVRVAHELCQRHCNRLGVDGLAEAVLRYFVYRLYEEGRVEP